jgi:hypothetical protein
MSFLNSHVHYYVHYKILENDCTFVSADVLEMPTSHYTSHGLKTVFRLAAGSGSSSQENLGKYLRAGVRPRTLAPAVCGTLSELFEAVTVLTYVWENAVRI